MMLSIHYSNSDKSATRMPLQVQDDIMKKIVEYMKAHDGVLIFVINIQVHKDIFSPVYSNRLFDEH